MTRRALAIVCCWSLACAGLGAHRLDEYLEATRVLITPERIELEMDLTPGLAVADAIIASIDADGDGQISAAEARAYSSEVLKTTTFEVDGQWRSLQLIDATTPRIDDMRAGVGAIRLRAVADTSSSAGVHVLRVRNDHRPDVGVYLANALMPPSDALAITGQERDPHQRELRIQYRVAAGAAIPAWPSLAVTVAGALLLLVWRRRSARSGPMPSSAPLV